MNNYISLNFDGKPYFLEKNIYNYITNIMLLKQNKEKVAQIFDQKLINSDFGINYKALQDIEQGIKPILLYGDPGSGKTSLAVLLGKQYGYEIKIVSFSEGKTENDLLNPTIAKDGKLNTNKGVLVDVCENAIMGKKMMLILDEVSRSSLEIQALLIEFLNDTNDKGRQYYVLRNVLDNKEYVVPKENLFVVATANVDRDTYITSALKDRFVAIELGYLPQDVEVLLLQEHGLDKNMAELLSQVASKSRILYKEGKIDAAFSTRKVLDIANTYKREIIGQILQNSDDIQTLRNKITLDKQLKIMSDAIIFHLDEITKDEEIKAEVAGLIKLIASNFSQSQQSQFVNQNKTEKSEFMKQRKFKA